MIEFELNGVTVTSEDDPSTPLLWVVRDRFKLKGSKFGCGAGLCGACTMQIDGKAVRTCILPVAAVAGQSVTTIEGLSQDGALHALQTAWVEHSVPQCGYCQSGQIMTAAGCSMKTRAQLRQKSIRPCLAIFVGAAVTRALKKQSLRRVLPNRCFEMLL